MERTDESSRGSFIKEPLFLLGYNPEACFGGGTPDGVPGSFHDIGYKHTAPTGADGCKSIIRAMLF